MRKHTNEIVRFAHTPQETEVWFKCEGCEWRKTKAPSWIEDCIYIVDDEYASLRKESIDSLRRIQILNQITKKWEIPEFKLEFGLPLENYRLEPEFRYPIYKMAKNNGSIVKFTSKQEGVIVKETEESRSIGHFVGHESKGWVEHTDTDVWEDYDHEEDSKIEYPIYKKNKVTGDIVKFTSLTTGIAIKNTKENSHYSNTATVKWVEHTDTDVWEDYDHEEDVKIEYPIYKKSTAHGFIVKFTDLNTGEVVENAAVEYIGHVSHTWVECTDARVWEDIKCKELKPTYYYKWERRYINNELIETTNWITDAYAEKYNFESNGWRKIENSKRIWEE